MKKLAPWLTILVLSLIPLLMVLGNSVLIPVLPEMQQRMHISKLQVSLLITLFSIPAGVVIPIAGFLSDRVGRKWVIVPSLLVFGVGGIVAGVAAWFVARPYAWVLIGRILQGIGASGTAPIAMAYIGDLFKGEVRSKALGVNEAGNALGKVVSPIIGSAVALIAWYAVFFIFPILCAPVAVALWRLVPDNRRPGAGQSLRQYADALVAVAKQDGRWLSVAYLCGAAALFTLFGALFYLSDLLESTYRMNGIIKGLVLAIPLLVLSTTSYLIGAVMKKRKALMKWLLVAGFCLLGASVLICTWLDGKAWPIVSLMSAGAVGTGMILPSLNMLITSAVSQEHRGVVTSLYGSVRFLGVALGPPVFTWLLDISSAAMFLFVTALAIVCALLVLCFVHPGRSPRGGETGAWRRVRIPGRHKARA